MKKVKGGDIMEMESSKQNERQSILFLCKKHKMKIAFIFVAIILFSGIIYKVETKDAFKITVNLDPSTTITNERTTLIVEIIPLEQVKGDFEIEIKPQDSWHEYICLHEESASYNSENQSWVIPLGKLDLLVGMNWEFVYYLTGNTIASADKWRIDVSVQYKPEINPDDIEEHSEILEFIVKKNEAVPDFLETNSTDTGSCLGSFMITIQFLLGLLVCYKRKGR